VTGVIRVPIFRAGNHGSDGLVVGCLTYICEVMMLVQIPAWLISSGC